MGSSRFGLINLGLKLQNLPLTLRMCIIFTYTTNDTCNSQVLAQVLQALAPTCNEAYASFHIGFTCGQGARDFVASHPRTTPPPTPPMPTRRVLTETNWMEQQQYKFAGPSRRHSALQLLLARRSSELSPVMTQPRLYVGVPRTSTVLKCPHRLRY